MERTTFFRLSSILVLVIVCLLLVTQIIRSSYVSLDSAAALSGQVAQASQSASSDESLPVPGKDFSLSDVKYLSNGNWAVVSFKPTSDDSFNAGFAILQKKDGIFRVVLGPSSTLSTDYTYSLPADVVGYLDEKGIFD